MAEQETISLDEEASAFLDQAAGSDKSAYINGLIKKEKQRVLKQAVLKANLEEAQDDTYHSNLSEWDVTLSDGLDD